MNIMTPKSKPKTTFDFRWLGQKVILNVDNGLFYWTSPDQRQTYAKESLEALKLHIELFVKREAERKKSPWINRK